jgi:hypothetical protein
MGRTRTLLGCTWLGIALCGGCRLGYEEVFGGFGQGADGAGASAGNASGHDAGGVESAGGFASSSSGAAPVGTGGELATAGFPGVDGTGGAAGATGSAGADSGGFAGASSLGDCISKPFDGHDYFFCNVKTDWLTARDNCASIGQYLARVDSTEENAFLNANAYVTTPVQGLWFGATDAETEGEWRWLDGDLFWLGGKSGTPQNGLFNDWYVGSQPAAKKALNDCLVGDTGTNGGWYDAQCTFLKEYVCESP